MALFFGLSISLAAAVIPTLLYALAFYLADRYEREPVWLVIIAFLWGAIPAIVASLIGELVIGSPLVNAPGSVAEAVVESAVVAPMVEEAMKGLAVWLIYKAFRQEFDGVLDGLTYGALIGFGFAMTENFLYFVGAFNNGGFVDLTLVIFLRSVIFGLNHALYTGLFGVGLGLARQASSPRASRNWAIAGFVAAVLTHALHNLGASISSITGIGIVLSLGLALLGAGLILLALLLTWRQERRWIRQELADEVGTLLTAEEYDSLTQGWRRSPLLDDRNNPDQAKRLRLLVELAFRQHRLQRLGTEREPRLSEQVADLRRQILDNLPSTLAETGAPVLD